MRYILFLLLLFIFSAQAQWTSYGSYNNYLPSDSKWDKTMVNDANTLGHWVFSASYHNDKDGGSDLSVDLSGNGNDLTAANFSANYTSELLGTSPVYEGGKAIKFNGIDQYFYIPAANAEDFNTGIDTFTVEAWFKDDLSGHYGLFSVYPGAQIYYIDLVIGKIDMRVDDNVTDEIYYSPVYYTGDTWTYLALVYYSTGYDVYINGDFKKTFTFTTPKNAINASSTNLYIGALNNTTYLSDGYLAEVRYSNKARTYSEIAAYYHQFIGF